MLPRPLPAVLVLLACAPARAAVLHVDAFDYSGEPLSGKGLMKFLAPAARRATGVPPEESGLYLADLDGREADGRPWWRIDGEKPDIVWSGADKVRLSLPWPIRKDGFSTVTADGGGKGYADGQTILLNEEIARTAYRRLQEALKSRKAAKPSYSPSSRVEKMVRSAMETMAKAHAAKVPRKRAALFDKALSSVSYAWQQVLYEHGRQIIADPKLGPKQRFGLSLDETLAGRLHEFDRLADDLADSGATWVRLVFDANLRDFTYSQRGSFSVYDKFVEMMGARKIRVMGSVLDSMLWPKNATPEAYQQRARNLALHYKDSIRSWEIASEPNADWIGGADTPLPREDVLLAVQKGVVAVKGVDKSLETVATLHWWEGTAKRPEYALFNWLDWATPRGFGRGLDVVALSAYPHRHPLGIAFDPVFSEINRRFPDKRLMLGGFSFADGDELKGYWWLEPGDVRSARKDLLVLYLGTAPAIPNSIGGGFYWPTLRLMLPPDRKPTATYSVYRRTLKRLLK